MGINITQAMNSYQFENREQQKNTAKQILSRQGASDENIHNMLNKTIFDYSEGKIYSNAQLAILKAASQISVNNTLKETLKYLKHHPAKKVNKEPVLGELWDMFTNEKNENYDLADLEIDYSIKNIFAAA